MSLVFFGWMGVLVAAAGPMQAAADIGMQAVTRPTADIILKFTQPGRIAEILVKDGDQVKAGQVLLRLDDEAERVKLAQLKADADDLLHIKAAEAQLAQKRADLKKLEWARQEGAATEWEIEHATLEVTIGEMSLAKTRFDHEQAQRMYEQARVQLERMKLASPIDGKVEYVFVEVGESVEALEQVIRVVKIDPLWADVPVPLERARPLALGQTMLVAFPEEGGKRVEGTVCHIAAIADAASETQTVRVEVPNPGQRPAGERVRVFMPAAAPAP